MNEAHSARRKGTSFGYHSGPPAEVDAELLARINAVRGGLVTYAEAAELVGVRPSTVKSWKRRGWLEPSDIGRPMLFHTDDVYRAERECRRRKETRPSDLTDTRPRVQPS